MSAARSAREGSGLVSSIICLARPLPIGISTISDRRPNSTRSGTPTIRSAASTLGPIFSAGREALRSPCGALALPTADAYPTFFILSPRRISRPFVGAWRGTDAPDAVGFGIGRPPDFNVYETRCTSRLSARSTMPSRLPLEFDSRHCATAETLRPRPLAET